MNGKRFSESVFMVGDNVLTRDYSKPNKKLWKRGKIEKILGDIMYLVKINENKLVLKRHLNQLIKASETLEVVQERKKK